MEHQEQEAPWYEQWFDENYLALYRHRDRGDAEEQVRLIIDTLKLSRETAILDLACGLNPLALPWIPLSPGGQYYACDIYADLAGFIRQFLSHLGVPGEVRLLDLTSPGSLPSAGTSSGGRGSRSRSSCR